MFNRFDVYRIQKERQTDRLVKYIYNIKDRLKIENKTIFFLIQNIKERP